MFIVFFSFLFRIVRIRRRRKVHIRYISSVMSFLFSLEIAYFSAFFMPNVYNSRI